MDEIEIMTHDTGTPVPAEVDDDLVASFISSCVVFVLATLIASILFGRLFS